MVLIMFCIWYQVAKLNVTFITDCCKLCNYKQGLLLFYYLFTELAGDDVPTKAQMELRLVQSKCDIEDPQICVKAEAL